MRILVVVCFVLLLASCGEKVEEFDGFRSIEVRHLLSADSNKVWIKTETRVNNEPTDNGCDDSLAYIFQTQAQNNVRVNSLYVVFDPSACTREQFCSDYPQICRAQEMLCEADTTLNCDSIPQNLFFAGSWNVVEPEIKNAPTHEFIINFPEDTTQYFINYITSTQLEITHSENGDEVFEKFTLNK